MRSIIIIDYQMYNNMEKINASNIQKKNKKLYQNPALVDIVHDQKINILRSAATTRLPWLRKSYALHK